LHNSFAWPEYLSRSILLVGTDYFLLYDQTGTNWRAGVSPMIRACFFAKENDLWKFIFFLNEPRETGTCSHGAFCNIGMNELVAPLYDLDIVQLAELRSAKGKACFFAKENDLWKFIFFLNEPRETGTCSPVRSGLVATMYKITWMASLTSE